MSFKKNIDFTNAKKLVQDNLDVIKLSLTECVDEGMIDTNDEYYNEVLGLIEESWIVKNWDELAEVVSKAKTLEIDIAGWLSIHGRTSISMEWPKIIPKMEMP